MVKFLNAIRSVSRRMWFLILGVILALVLVIGGVWPLSSRTSVDLGHVSDASVAQDVGVVGPPEAGGPGVIWQVPRFWAMDDIVSTASGPAMLVKNDYAADSREKIGWGNAVVSLDPDNGSVRWYRFIKTGDVAGRAKDERKAEILASPDGRYMAVSLASVRKEDPSAEYPSRDHADAAADRKSQTIVVLSAENGEVVRTMHTDQVVLGQALTNKALVVETSPLSYPDGGTVTSYPLDSPEASPSSWAATGWLLGSTADSIILSPQLHCKQDGCSTVTLTLADPATGQPRRTVDHVWNVDPSGWAVRYTDAADADDTQQRPYEIVDLESDARTDITGLTAETRLTPTGTIRLLKPGREDPPVSWLPGPNDPHQTLTPRTEPVEIIDDTSRSCISGIKDCVQRTTLTMGSS